MNKVDPLINTTKECSLISEEEQFPKTFEEVLHKLARYNIDKNECKIHKDLSVTVSGDVFLNNKNLQYLPIKFKKIKGDFHCHVNQLITLRGAPEEVGGDFLCGSNQLTSLKWSPKTVGKNFVAANNQITTLIDCSTEYAENFILTRNLIKVVDYLPQGVKELCCIDNLITHFSPNLANNNTQPFLIDITNNNFTSLESLSQFTAVRDLRCAYNKINSIKISKTLDKLKSLGLSNNNLESFENTFAPNLNTLILTDNPIVFFHTNNLRNLRQFVLLNKDNLFRDFKSLYNLLPKTELMINFDQIDEDLRIKFAEKFINSAPIFLKDDSISKIPRKLWKQKILEDFIIPLKKQKTLMEIL